MTNKTFILILLSFLGIASPIAAQRNINVKGKVMHYVFKSINGKKEKALEPFDYVHVYGVPDKTAADYIIQQHKDLTDRNIVWEVCIYPMYHRSRAEGITASDGTYSVKDVVENGYLVFLPYSGTAKSMSINGMLEMEDLIYEEESDGSIELGAVNVMAEDLGPLIDAEVFGNIHSINSQIPIDTTLQKKNIRVVIQPYFVDCTPSSLPENIYKDTTFLSPIVYYGNQNILTQERRLNFSINNDSLISYKTDTLKVNNGKLLIKKKYQVPDPKRNYKAYAELFYEDYNGVLQQNIFVIKHCENKEPMHFLDFDFGAMFLDPNSHEFEVRPEENLHDAVGDINLTFLVGKAELDSNNEMNDIEIDRLQNEMIAIETSKNNLLRTLTIIGKASPEGSYESNRLLAERRMDFALKKITSVFNQYTMNRLKNNIKKEAIVTGWDELASLLEQDSLFADAESIKNIVSKYEGKHDIQSAQIRNLSCYKLIKEKYLPKLRSVKYQYTYQTMRALTDAEILEKYSSNKDSINKNIHYDKYEYWRLAVLTKDSTDLADIYKRYYEFTKSTQRNADELAACNYAAFCIRNGICDTTIVTPFIRKGRKVNFKMKNAVEEDIIVNREEIIANQLAMYVLGKDYLNARIMSSILPDNERTELLKAFLKCLSGHYRKETYYKPVEASSTNNKIVINIAIDNLALAQVVAEEELKDYNPRKYYFLAQIEKKKNDGETNNLINYLFECFKRDESFIEIADADATFVDNKGNKKEFDQAVKKFDEYKKKQQNQNNNEGY